MNGTSVFRFVWTPRGNFPTSMHEVIVFLALLSGLLHNEPALADGCPAPSFAAPVIYDGGAIPYSLASGDFNGVVSVTGRSGVAVLLNTCACAGINLSV